MVTIAVHGTASRKVPPELARVVVVSTATGDDRGAVVSRVVAQHERLAGEAARFEESGAAEGWHSDGLTTGITWDWHTIEGSNERHRQFCADADVTVTFRDVASLQTWLVDVAQRDDVEVSEVRWELTDASRTAALSLLRAAAVTDAVTRAVDLADAAGLGTPRLAAIFEPGLRPGTGEGGPVPMYARAMAADSGGGGGLDLRPQDIELTAAVSADFVTD
ncbi:SIMPL domain-containing protein [Salana multivorans]